MSGFARDAKWKNMFKVGDKVKTSCQIVLFDNLIGKISEIDEGYEGKGPIKVFFDILHSYNHITGKIVTHYNTEIRFNPEELRVIHDSSSAHNR